MQLSLFDLFLWWLSEDYHGPNVFMFSHSGTLTNVLLLVASSSVLRGTKCWESGGWTLNKIFETSFKDLGRILLLHYLTDIGWSTVGELCLNFLYGVKIYMGYQIKCFKWTHVKKFRPNSIDTCCILSGSTISWTTSCHNPSFRLTKRHRMLRWWRWWMKMLSLKMLMWMTSCRLIRKLNDDDVLRISTNWKNRWL